MLLVSAGKHPYEDNMSGILARLKFAIRTTPDNRKNTDSSETE
jgi:hypothetical protein